MNEDMFGQKVDGWPDQEELILYIEYGNEILIGILVIT